MGRTGHLLRRRSWPALLVVVAVLATVALGAVAPVGAGAAPTTSGAPATPGAPGASGAPEAPVAPEAQAALADGSAEVIAVTSAPGDQVVDDVLAAVPDGSVSEVSAGRARQVALTVDAKGLDALRGAPHVQRIVENGKNFLTEEAWSTAVGASVAHTGGWDGTGQTVAVLDSGVQADHPYLAGKVVAQACFSGAYGSGTASLCPGVAGRASGPGTALPCTGVPECRHGTHVAGIAAGGPVTSPRSLSGVAPGASVVAVQVFTKGTTEAVCGGAPPCLFAYDSDIDAALQWLYDQKVAGTPGFGSLAAVNLSLGGGLHDGPCDTDPTKPYVDQLRSVGVATVAATGNDYRNGAGGPAQMAAPACISSVVSVAATNGAGALASYTDLAAGTTLLAPGTAMFSSTPGSAYASLSGTSMAAPVVTGALALLRQRWPSSSVTGRVGRLQATADAVPTALGPRPEVELAAALLGVPNGVRDVVASPGDGAVTLSWSPPSYQGDTSITGYLVTSTPAGGACATSGATSCVLTGLSNGTPYTFTIQASNAGGAGAVVVSPAVVPRTVPGPPVAVTATSGHEELTASWRPPASDGGAPVTGYRATAEPGGRSCTTADTTCTITGLAIGRPYTVTVVASNEAGDGPGSAPSAPAVPVWLPDLPAGSPIGSLDTVTGAAGSVSVAGWAIDPETRSPIAVHVYVDGRGTALMASSSRPDVGAAYPRYGAAHGFSTRIAAAAGAHRVCAYGIDVGVGGNRLLGCRTVTVPTGPPIGSLDAATAGVGSVSVAGWAIDPDTADPIAVHVYVDGRGTALVAGASRPDVGAAFPGYGPSHGFAARVAVPGGPHAVCAYGIDARTGSNSVLGCRVVMVPTGPPFGSLDVVSRSGSTVTVSGWAIDPDTTGTVQVQVFVGATRSTVTANRSRPDVGAAYPLYGPEHGFSATLPAAAGRLVCVVAADAGGSRTLLGCG